MKTSKPLSLLLSLLTSLAVLSGSIAAPLLCRPFYYAHIDALGLVEYTGLTREQITEAFDQMMDYCLGQRPNFAAGVLPFSASGASHFADVEEAARFMLEVAKYFGKGDLKFYDEEEYELLKKLYGPMNHLQTLGKAD